MSDKFYYKNSSRKIVPFPDEEAQVSMTLALASDITKLNLSDLSKFYEKEFKIDDYEGRGYEYLIFNYDNSLINDINMAFSR